MINSVNNMKFFLAVILGFFLSAPAFAIASVSRLEVQFESVPLFLNANFIPYDEVSRFVKIINNTDTTQEAVVEAINYSSCPLFSFETCLAKKLHLKITSGAEVYFDDTLSEFYDMRGVTLGNIAGAGAMKQYDFRIVFEGGADDNDFQNSTTNFDLLVGFAGEDGGSADGGETSGGGGGSSGGGGASLPGLQINNESIASVSEDSVSISWNTNYEAYGHVIYGIDTGTPYSLELSQPNFGYQHSVPTDPALSGHDDPQGKVKSHSFLLTGLTPGKTYRYRTVSHASPPTVGYEHTFTVPLNTNVINGNEEDSIGGSSEFPDESKILVQGKAADFVGQQQKNVPHQNEMVPENDRKESQKNFLGDMQLDNDRATKNFAAAFESMKNIGWLWLAPLIFVIAVSFRFFRRKG